MSTLKSKVKSIQGRIERLEQASRVLNKDIERTIQYAENTMKNPNTTKRADTSALLAVMFALLTLATLVFFVCFM